MKFFVRYTVGKKILYKYIFVPQGTNSETAPNIQVHSLNEF